MQVPIRYKKVDAQKGWIKWLFLGVIWLLIISMTRDYLQTKKGFLRIKETEDRLVKVKTQNEDLKKRLEIVSSPEYKEQLVREKLNMQRTDEIVVILPGREQNIMGLEKTEKLSANWEKWLEVLGIN